MFIPPFCPRQDCVNHQSAPAKKWWQSSGHHMTKAFGEVKRFRCPECEKTFSVQTFKLDYWAKRRFDFRRLEQFTAMSMSVRSLARAFACSCGTILNRHDRLARQALALHAELRPLAARGESVCVDGFVSFDRSQYFPNDISIAISGGSRFVLSFSHATLRRSGRMTEKQKTRRREIDEEVSFEPKAVERSFREILDSLDRERPPEPGRPLVVITDEKREYDRAFRKHRLFREQDGERRTAHLRVSSKLPRVFWNPLFPSNYLDRELRKDQAAHRRESTCFARNASNMMARLAQYVSWRNYEKRFLVKAKVARKETHASMAGLDPVRVAARRDLMFRERAVLSRITLDPLDRRIWTKEVPTPFERKAGYLPKFALA
jgi:hypothetical protein